MIKAIFYLAMSDKVPKVMPLYFHLWKFECLVIGTKSFIRQTMHILSNVMWIPVLIFVYVYLCGNEGVYNLRI